MEYAVGLLRVYVFLLWLLVDVLQDISVFFEWAMVIISLKIELQIENNQMATRGEISGEMGARGEGD